MSTLDQFCTTQTADAVARTYLAVSVRLEIKL
ncbi:hypothetical protein SBBP2_1640004 [Burkholderiales bacterium]|nr:hypothetical protein SBBP2_1640004 [Burkholderiales bacterium]